MCLTKKLLSGVVIATLSFFYFPFSVFASEETSFIITAYYSPVKWQAKYLHGSYEREIYINGKGTHGASGKEVFVWMLAAPKKYPFWTKIHFEWYWVAEVQDRGWAIVSAGSRGNSYDRIDIWMWHWDEGRERAVLWGKKTIKGKIVNSDTPNSLKFDEKTPVNYLSLRVNPGSWPTDIKNLQELFQEAGLYSWAVDGNYDSIKQTLIDFQLEHDIIPSADHESAGYFGAKTLSVVSKMIELPQDTLSEEAPQNFHWAKNQEITKGQEILMNYGEFRANPESSRNDIRKLQGLLKELWKYNWEIDGNYKSVENDLITFQIELWIVRDSKDWWAGYYGSQTRSVLWKHYETAEIDLIQKQEDSVPVEKESVVENEIEDKKQKVEKKITSSHRLSSTEKTKIKKAISLIKKRLLKEESSGGKWMERVLNELSEQIEEILPSIDDQELLAKLILINEEIK